jgi:zinc/manganese transport system substrate-binding protein
MKNRSKTFVLLAAGLLAGSPAGARAERLRVVTTIEDLASLAREVGGDEVDASALAKGYQDPHFVEAKPSYLLRLRDADLFVQSGLELEVAWAPSLLGNARNPRVLPGAPGFLDASEGCDILEIPSGAVDRSRGDLHPYGNPHYWTDPENGRVVARNIARRLTELRPEKADLFAARLADFERRLDAGLARWTGAMEPYRGTAIVTYHNSWPNFIKRFGLRVADFVEPKPGIPPSPQHLRRLEERIRAERIPVILMEPYFDRRLPEKVALDSGAELLIFPPSVGGEPALKTYLDVFDANVGRLVEALRRKKGG